MPKKGGKRVSVADEYDDKYEYNYECDDHDHYQVECIEQMYDITQKINGIIISFTIC